MRKAPDITALGEYLVNFLCAERRGVLSMEGHPGGAPADLLTMASPPTELLTKVDSNPFGLFLAGGQRRAPARRVRHVDASPHDARRRATRRCRGAQHNKKGAISAQPTRKEVLVLA